VDDELEKLIDFSLKFAFRHSSLVTDINIKGAAPCRKLGWVQLRERFPGNGVEWAPQPGSGDQVAPVPPIVPLSSDRRTAVISASERATPRLERSNAAPFQRPGD
jgi:hypothetical protein